MSVKPHDITAILNVAVEARKNGDNFVPCLRGEAGLGKSKIPHDWAMQNEYQMIDLRLALLEAPDLVGFPEVIKQADGTTLTKHSTPDFWPRDPNSKGILFLDELNRGDTSVTNAIMQLLTERKVGSNYTLPEGWIILSAINGDDYDVNTMDAALADRVAIFDVVYDKRNFMSYMKAKKFNQNIQAYVKSSWDYKTPAELGEDGTYVSPRSWERLNIFLKTKHSEDLFFKTAVSILGKGLGREFYAFCTDNRPLYASDFDAPEKVIKANLKLLKSFSQGDKAKRRSDLVSVTLDSVLDDIKDRATESHITKDLAAEIAMCVPADQSIEFLKSYVHLVQQNEDPDNFEGLEKYMLRDRPDLHKYLKGRIKDANNE